MLYTAQLPLCGSEVIYNYSFEVINRLYSYKAWFRLMQIIDKQPCYLVLPWIVRLWKFWLTAVMALLCVVLCGTLACWEMVCLLMRYRFMLLWQVWLSGGEAWLAVSGPSVSFGERRRKWDHAWGGSPSYPFVGSPQLVPLLPVNHVMWNQQMVSEGFI